jgi:hypothetical protein
LFKAVWGTSVINDDDLTSLTEPPSLPLPALDTGLSSALDNLAIIEPSIPSIEPTQLNFPSLTSSSKTSDTKTTTESITKPPVTTQKQLPPTITFSSTVVNNKLLGNRTAPKQQPSTGGKRVVAPALGLVKSLPGSPPPPPFTPQQYPPRTSSAWNYPANNIITNNTNTNNAAQSSKSPLRSPVVHKPPVVNLPVNGGPMSKPYSSVIGRPASANLPLQQQQHNPVFHFNNINNNPGWIQQQQQSVKQQPQQQQRPMVYQAQQFGQLQYQAHQYHGTYRVETRLRM